MTSRAQNLLMLLGILIIGFFGYYLYTQKNVGELDTDMSMRAQVDAQSAALLANLTALTTITLDGTFFSDGRLGKLMDYSTPVSPRPFGKSNPFGPN